MKVTVLGGAGKVAMGAIQDLVENRDVKEILLADLNMDALEKRKQFLNSNKINISYIDLNDHESLVGLLKDSDVCLNGCSHVFNLKVMKACVDSKTNYTDFGGLFHWAKEQLKMHDDFKQAGITGIVGSGSAPGIVNVMAKYAYERLDRIESVHIRDAIVNFNQKENDFVPPYAIGTLLDEYIMNPYEFRNGEYVEKAPFSGGETFSFPPPIGEQTVLNTIHSEVATIPLSFKDKGIQDVTFKLALPKFFEEKLRFLVEMGFGDKEEIDVQGQKISPRKVLESIIEKKNNLINNDDQKHDDHKILRVEVKGEKNGENIEYIIETILSPYAEWPHLSQGVFSVGFPAAVTTRILGNNQIKESGFFASEQAIPTQVYFEELAKRGIHVEVSCKKNVIDTKELAVK
ncbi:saccharopine dehydrogenase family protein [Salinicoccus kekensis]|uniref:Saccharopine dehydrogenase-like NADP-dependent oxidoreductase n=1 Tax=Salinicoccus kekensis TaxID=714307 RepID=A0A285UPD7_9STAP|nr:saccharopine dehydrogenase C-terminal domain-containing protein [Salinicoccus kekensis]SOC43692.1 saccharopine dehydrogenase-like NADP-dependent oxidoreductase [Salinicoccus kekensis]